MNDKVLKLPQKSDGEDYLRCIAPDVKLGTGVYLSKFINLYGCQIGDHCKVGAFAEIQKGVTIGNNTKICTNTLICSGVKIGSGCFIGNGTVFVNDNHPRALNEKGALEIFDDWKNRYVETVIEDYVSIGSNCTIIGGITIGRGAIIGAGSVVTKDVPPGEVWVGNPALSMRYRKGLLGFIRGIIYRIADLFTKERHI